jgi:glycosyltransferase involved in cell wall biosynthesis
MRVTFICPTASVGGGSRVVAIYARSLKQMGHEVCVVSPPPQLIAPTQKVKSWLKGHGWPDEKARGRSHLHGADFDHRVLDRYRPVTDEDVPDGDVVIATWWETAEWVAALSARKGAKAYFIQHHEIHDYLPQARTRDTYRLPFHKIVIARWLEQVMNEQYGDKIVDVVPNSVDRQQFFGAIRGKQAKPTVGFLYATASFKGIDTTLTALRLVRKRIFDLRIVSFGAERPSARLPLPVGTEYFYLPPQHELRNLYARCDVWVTASRSEGFNLPALEAMACRTPVVSTRTGWPKEAIKTRRNGVLVDVDNAPELAQGVEWVLMRDDRDWRNLSQNAYKTSTVGSWQESAQLFEAALERACRRAACGEIQGKCTLAARTFAREP